MKQFIENVGDSIINNICTVNLSNIDEKSQNVQRKKIFRDVLDL